jgi:hypothetical protein
MFNTTFDHSKPSFYEFNEIIRRDRDSSAIMKKCFVHIIMRTKFQNLHVGQIFMK